MKNISFIKGLVLSIFLSIIILSCQSDESSATTTAVAEPSVSIATDARGVVADSIPVEILKIMVAQYQDSGATDKIQKLKKSYDFETGKLTDFAKQSTNYKKMKLASSGKIAEMQPDHYMYRAHVAKIGWMPYEYFGQPIGTTGLSRAIEAIEFNYPAPVCVHGIAHIQGVGWYTSPIQCDNVFGFVGLNRRLEAIRMYMGGYHRAYVQNIGWMPWVAANIVAGTENISARMESYQYSTYIIN